MNLILFIDMLFVFTIYNVYIACNYGFLSSISVSYYYLPEKRNWLFLAFCWLYAIPAVMLSTNGFMFFSGGLICFVGVASAFRIPNVGVIHQVSALTAIVLSQLAILFCYHLYILNVIMVLATVVLFLLRDKFAQWMYFLEVIAFMLISIALGLQL